MPFIFDPPHATVPAELLGWLHLDRAEGTPLSGANDPLYGLVIPALVTTGDWPLF